MGAVRSPIIRYAQNYHRSLTQLVAVSVLFHRRHPAFLLTLPGGTLDPVGNQKRPNLRYLPQHHLSCRRRSVRFKFHQCGYYYPPSQQIPKCIAGY